MSTNQAGPAWLHAVTQECQNLWAVLRIQLSPLNNIIAIDERDYLSWNRADQQFILNSYLRAAGQMPMFVRDSAAPRVFLGPSLFFQRQLLITPPGHLSTMAHMPQHIPPPLPAQAVTPPAQSAQVTTPASGVATSPTRASSPQSDGEKIPRPANAWIMYRKHNHASFVAANPGIHNNQISGLISTKWHAEPQAVRDYWHMLADQAKAEHKLKYPEYTYKPRKSSEKKRRMSKKKAAELAAKNEAAASTIPTSKLPEQHAESINNAIQGPVDHIEEAKLFAQALSEDYHSIQGEDDLSYLETGTAEYEGEQYQAESEANVDDFFNSFFGWN